MFLVGLDIVGEKILEINVFTPGGLWNMSEMYKTDFMQSVITVLESKLAIRDAYPSVSNRELATIEETPDRHCSDHIDFRYSISSLFSLSLKFDLKWLS